MNNLASYEENLMKRIVFQRSDENLLNTTHDELYGEINFLMENILVLNP